MNIFFIATSRRIDFLSPFRFSLKLFTNYIPDDGIKKDTTSKTSEIIKKPTQAKTKRVNVNSPINSRKYVDRKHMHKKKVLNLLKDIESYKESTIPKFLLSTIRECSITFENMNEKDRNDCAKFFKICTKYNLLLLVYQTIENEKELKFVKKTFLNKNYMDFLFRQLENTSF